MTKKRTKHNLPGTIYKNGRRWWWKVKLPGEQKTKARPLKPMGSTMATNDYNVAVECAKMLLARAVFEHEKSELTEIKNIAQLCRAYLGYARAYYKNTRSNGEPKQIEYAMRHLLELYSSLEIEQFGPLKLNEVRDLMIKQNVCRTTINQRTNRLKRMFKWGVSQQVVSPILYQGLMTVEGLKFGRCDARESEPVKPVAEEYVYKVLPYLTPVLSAVVRIQLLTGMRPSEVLQMKPKQIDRSGDIWHYRPEHHKTLYRGIDRIVPIGPEGQKILAPFLLRSEDSFCFSPKESEKYRRDKMTQNRKTPSYCGNTVGSNRADNPKRRPGDFYYFQAYGRAISRALERARADIKSKGGDPDKELPKWTPYQLRHTAATKARKMFNYETAGALLGHSNMSATAIYAERNQGLADEVARRIG